MVIITPDRNFKFTGRDGTSDDIVVWEQFACNAYGISAEDFKDCKVVFDIGANIGAFTAYALSLDPEARVYAFEPQNENRALLMENLQQNRLLDKVMVEKQAVGGDKKLAYITNEYGSSKITGEGQPCEMLRMDELFPLHGVHDVAILKIDIEGSEYHMLMETRDDTLQKVRKLVMEFHATDAETFGEFVSRLNRIFNLTIEGSHEVGGTLTGVRR